MIEFDEKRKLFTVNWFRFLNFDAITWEFSNKRADFQNNQQLMIEFDKNRKLFIVSRT